MPAHVGQAPGELQPSKFVPFEEPQELGIAAERLKDLPGRLLRQRRVEAARVHANLDRGGPLGPRYGFHLGKPNRTTIADLTARRRRPLDEGAPRPLY